LFEHSYYFRFFDLLFVFPLFRSATSFSAGAPLSSCRGDLSPRHGFTAQTGKVPVEIVLDQDTISHKEYLRVTIRSSQAYKGYLVRAVDRNASSLGSWFIPDYDLTSQYLHCGVDRPQSSVTHTSLTTSMYQLYLQWKPYQHYHGQVNIVATIVINYTTYCTGVTSRPVQWGLSRDGELLKKYAHKPNY
jgi:hypothetical protein